MKKLISICCILATTIAQAGTIEDKMAAYRDCTESAMPLLDDRVSDAETIATGLHAQCREQFEAIYQERPGISRAEWFNILKPHLVQSLLKYRAMRQVPATSKVKPTS